MTPDELREARLTLGLSQGELGVKLDVARQLVNQMEQGKPGSPITRRTALSMAHLLEERAYGKVAASMKELSELITTGRHEPKKWPTKRLRIR